MSPIDGIGLPFFNKYLEKLQIESKNFYVFFSATVWISEAMLLMCNKTIVHADSLRNNDSKNATSKATATTLFEEENNYKSYFE